MTGKRPDGVTLLAVLAVLGGILALLGAVFGLMVGQATIAGLTGPEAAMASVMLGGMTLYGAVMGVISLVVGWGLWNGKSWAWWLTVIFSALGVLTILMLNPLAIVNAIILWYMFKPHVKEFFGVEVGFST